MGSVGFGFLLVALLLLVAAIAVFYAVRRVHSARILGFDLLRLSMLALFLALAAFFAVQLIPAKDAIRPEDYAGASLNAAAEGQLDTLGFPCDPGTLAVHGVASGNFYEALLCVYRADGQEAGALLRFDRDVYGNLARPQAWGIGGSPVIIGEDDGIFGHYLLIAGRGGGDTEMQDDRFRLTLDAPDGAYYLHTTLTKKPWLGLAGQFLLVFVVTLAAGLLGRGKKYSPVRLYERRRPGDPVLRVQYYDKMENEENGR